MKRLLASLASFLVMASLEACAIPHGPAHGVGSSPPPAAPGLGTTKAFRADTELASRAHCTGLWETDSDGWWDCYLTAETERCERQATCGDQPDPPNAPYKHERTAEEQQQYEECLAY